MGGFIDGDKVESVDEELEVWVFGEHVLPDDGFFCRHGTKVMDSDRLTNFNIKRSYSLSVLELYQYTITVTTENMGLLCWVGA